MILFHAFLPRDVLRGLLVIASVFLSGATSSIGLQQCWIECESPLDAEGSTEEAIAQVQGVTKLRQRLFCTVVVAQKSGKHLDAAHLNQASPDGHRLHNNLMAPLRL